MKASTTVALTALAAVQVFWANAPGIFGRHP
jgi:hypothetical protein